MASIGHFAANFFNGLTQGKLLKQKQDEEKKERDAKLKLFEIQLAREQRQMQQDIQQQEARQGLLNKMNGAEALPGTGVPLMDPTKKGMSLTELLADPESAMQLLQSGMVKGDDILKQQESSANRAMLEKLMAGGIGGSGLQGSGMELTGVKVGGGGQIMPDFGLPQVTSPQTVMGPNGPELATFNPRTGSRTATLGTPKPDTVQPETAGRISGLVQGREIAQQVRAKYIKPDGSIDNALVFTAFTNAPGSQGRSVRNDILIAVDSVLRARTGAGVNIKEQGDVIEQFMPHPLDSDQGKLQKLDRLDQFIDGTLDIATLPPALRKRLEEADKKSGGGSKSKVVDFNALPK